MQELFEPLSAGKLELSNRLVMAPMTRSRATEDGAVTGLTVEYYRQRAAAGLIITEGTQPSVRGQGYILTPGLHDDGHVTAWRAVTDAVHAEGGRIFAQLMHAGRVGHPVLYPDGGVPLGPSPLASGEKLFTPDGMLDHPVPREMTVDDIAQAVEEFAASARNAVEAGFDGVELHGANGYLIQQFLADGSNTRTDAYGGTIANRIRFGVEVARAVSEAIGPDRVGFRVSPGGTANGVSESDTAELYAALLAALAPLGLAYLHIMELGDRDMTRRLRAAWPGTLILNPHPTPESFPARPEYGAEALRDGVADAVAFAEMWLANPDLPARIRAGGPYNEADRATFYGGDHRGYTDYPVLA
ncbi:alkene reductase [Actinomadura madurae]|uniref:alkene reductase n=1 Tax=Actinomadura madurae TaxID=1993 RepID=UPI0020262BF2|nr:alkene reductase [Actinomadura madurae]MCP9950870.1 alkene reductase [Actinomadura madurae]MCP9967654.1 alkene reductase [Actinomadura madurae]MCP9980104.1 alkene reductase [Actinomadura madurae]MCQ0008368.1 alkene reductase [Actinomadura madurae]URM96394.1 alkene reductase [Actinomadura madurae]